MTWLLTGGAGYIGAHVARAFAQSGFGVVVLDDLSTGIRGRLTPDTPFVPASVLDTDAVRLALREHAVTGVVHLAAKKAVGESVARPLHYWQENVGGIWSLLDAMLAEHVDQLVFASSAAVYGDSKADRVDEESEPLRPTNPYGETKVACERMIERVSSSTGLRWAALRAFNVTGTATPHLADRSGSNLVPLVFAASRTGNRPTVFGADYPTADGSCERDYVHVADVAEAHVAAARALAAGRNLNTVYNLGRGVGSSVKQVVQIVAEVTGTPNDYQVAPRRPGDPARLVALTHKANAELKWRSSQDLRDILESVATADADQRLARG